MRNTIHVREGGPMFACSASIAMPGTLIVVEDEKTAKKMRALVTVFGQKCVQAEVAMNPEANMKHVQMTCVEVRTLAEIEQMDANEKMAMEVW